MMPEFYVEIGSGRTREPLQKISNDFEQPLGVEPRPVFAHGSVVSAPEDQRIRRARRTI